MAVLVTERLLPVFKSNHLCHALPSINRVMSHPRLLALALLFYLLQRPGKKPSSCSYALPAFFLFLVLYRLPPAANALRLHLLFRYETLGGNLRCVF